jgi:hypothetical protein
MSDLGAGGEPVHSATDVDLERPTPGACDIPKFGGGRTTTSTSDVMIIGGTSVNGKKVFVLQKKFPDYRFPLSSFALAVGALEEVSDLFLYIRGGGADIDGGVRWGGCFTCAFSVARCADRLCCARISAARSREA